MEILYEDKWIVVCIKPSGVLSEEFGRGKCMPELLKKQTGAYKIGVVHRLDKPASGVMVYSKNRQASAELSKAIARREFVKEYLCVVSGVPETPSGEMRDFLFRDSNKNKSYVVKTLRKGAKEALLSYETLETVKSDGKGLSLVKVKLATGRTHQIRVQFSSRGMPLYGDSKYGGTAADELALFSFRLCFRHPVTGDTIDITHIPEKRGIWKNFNINM